MRHGVLVEGVEADGDCLFERAFQFGDGLFETVAVVDGNPCLWNAHMARLAEGCRRLRLPEPDFRLLAEEARRLCAGHRRVVLKVFWTAGRSQRGYRRPAPVAPRRMLQCSEWPGGVEGRSWELRRCAYRLGENPALAGIKHLNRLDQVVARAEWKDADFSEGLLLGQDGRVVCGTMSNIFVQRGDVLFTPVIDGAGIAGVVRALALDIGRGRRGEAVREQRIALDQLLAADAVYLTNSLIGVARVARYESTRFCPGTGEHPVMADTRLRCHRSENWGLGYE